MGLSIHILPHLSPFIPTVMMSQFSAFLLRSRCVAPLTRSRMLSIPALASRTPVMTKARVGTQDTRTWHLTIVTVGLLSTVFRSLLASIFSFDPFDRTCSMHVTCSVPRRCVRVCGHDDTSAVICLLYIDAVSILQLKPHLSLLTNHLWDRPCTPI